MTKYHKLVRDKIPDIIRAGGEVPQIRILDNEEYLACLDRKLNEEVAEFHSERNLEELADILEVVYALAEGIGSDRQALEYVYAQKHEARGGFRERIYLISKE